MLSKDIDREFNSFTSMSAVGKAFWFLKQDNVWGDNLRFTVWRRLYFIFMCFAKQEEIARLLDVLSSDKELFTIANRFPCILELGYRSWLYYKATTADRVDAIESHFSILQRVCDSKLIEELYSDRGLVLWKDNDTKVYLRLYYSRTHRKEGLLACELGDASGMLYMTDIWLTNNAAGELSAYIGSLQGSKERQEDFTAYTKHYFGLRTKVMLLDALRFALMFLNIRHIYAVSDYGACVNHKLSPKRRVQFSLNDLWTELGGHPSEDDRFYELPLLPTRRPLAELPTKRRAKHRKQYEFLDEMQAAIIERLKEIK